jgi:mono/diheme cytochrome c family protein
MRQRILTRFIHLFVIASAFFIGSTAYSLGADGAVADVYKSKCQGCHGADGRASAIGKKLGARDFHDPEVVKASKAELLKIIMDGKGKMPAYKGKLTREQMDGLLKYIKEMK